MSERAKLLRGVAGIAGISDRAMAKVIAWVRDHPEVDCGCYMCTTRAAWL